MSDLLTIDQGAFRDGYGRSPFRVTHDLGNHPLLSLEKLAELADFLPEHRVEHNKADIPELLPSAETESVAGTPGEVVRGIMTNGTWMILRHIQLHPEYSRLLDETLDEVMPYVRERDGEMLDRVGFIFLTSPGGTTPAHTDPEHNFLLQVRGFKEMVLGAWPSKRDEQLELERQIANGFNTNLEAMPGGAETYRLDPGDGLYVPIHAPHFVRNGDAVSISLSITWQTPASRREYRATSVNTRLRRVGLSPGLPGERAASDRVKAAAFGALQRARRRRD
jgi:hypothetical protein